MAHTSTPEGNERALLHDAGLRCTASRLEVLRVMRQATSPLSHREAAECAPDLDRVTVFRNLVALVDAGLLRRVDLGDRVWRYEWIGLGAHDEEGHPHFTCERCGATTCLDAAEIQLRHDDPRWDAVLADAVVQLRGVCTACR